MRPQLGLDLRPLDRLSLIGLALRQMADVVELLRGLHEVLVLLDGEQHRPAAAALVHNVASGLPCRLWLRSHDRDILPRLWHPVKELPLAASNPLPLRFGER